MVQFALTLLLVFQTAATFLYALGAYSLAARKADLASEELFVAFGEREVQGPAAKALEDQLKKNGYLDPFGDLDTEHMTAEDHQRIDEMEELALEFGTGYADWKMSRFFRNLAEKKKKNAERNTLIGIVLITAATALLVATGFSS